MDCINHGNEILVRHVVNDAVTASGNPAPTGLKYIHVFPDITLDILGRSFYEGPGQIDIAMERDAVAITFFIIAIILTPCRMHITVLVLKRKIVVNKLLENLCRVEFLQK